MSVRDTWAVVPVKRLPCAKSRLGDVLTGAERALLAQTMLRDVLGVLRRVPGLAGTLVVTDDPGVTHIAQTHDCVVVPEQGEAGLNAAVMRGIAWLHHARQDGVIVLPGDVPLVTKDEIEQVLAALCESVLILAPAKRDGGTNLIAARPSGLVVAQFGEASFRRHLRDAQARGIDAHVLHLSGIGSDVDGPRDLAEHAGSDRSTLTSELLRRLNVITRMRETGSLTAAGLLHV